MATRRRSNSSEPAAVHAEHDWDAQKSNFFHCYIKLNLTLEKATNYMAENHGFRASSRQWERRAKHWGFKKYESKEDRLKQLEGGTKGDRNLRRFLHRHNKSRDVSPGATDRPLGAPAPGRQRGSTTSSINRPMGPDVATAESEQDLDFLKDSFTNNDLTRQLSSQSSELPGQFAGLSTEQFDTSSDPTMEDATYGLFMTDDVYQDLNGPDPPSHFGLEARREAPGPDSPVSPVQLHIRNHQNSGPEVLLTMCGDSAQLSSIPLDLDSHVTNGIQPPGEQSIMPHSVLGDHNTYLPIPARPYDLADDSDQSSFEMDNVYEPANERTWIDPSILSNQDPSDQTRFDHGGYEEEQSGALPRALPGDMATTYHNPTHSYGQTAESVSLRDVEMPQLIPFTSDESVEQDTTSFQGSGVAPDASDPHRLGTDFLLRVSDYTKSVKRTVKRCAAGKIDSSEIERLKQTLNSQRITFSDDMRVRLENLIRAMQRITQDDRAMIRRLRQQNVAQQQQHGLLQVRIGVLERIIEEKGFDLQQEVHLELQRSVGNI